jgi:phosphoglycolate phosphatase
MNYKAVLFDLDGTLIDSLAGLAEAMNLLLARLGYPTHPVEEYKYFVGSGIEEAIRRALPEQTRHTAPIERLAADYRALYDTIWPQQSPAYEGVPDMLAGLRKKKIKTAVLSNKSDDFTRRMTAKLFPDHEFAEVQGERRGVPRKPDPTAALQIAERLGIKPADFIFLGDSGIDMETAVRAGMYPLGALWGFRQAEELSTHGACDLLHHPLELLSLLERIGDPGLSECARAACRRPQPEKCLDLLNPTSMVKKIVFLANF